MKDWLSRYLPLFEGEGLASGAVAQPTEPPLVVDPPSITDPAPEPSARERRMIPIEVMTRRVEEETGRRHAAEQRAEAAERRGSEFEALAQRLQQRAPAADGSTPPSRASEPPPAQTDAARRSEIQAEAQRQRFYEDTVTIRNKGLAELGPAFGESLNILGALGATTDDFIADAMAVGGVDKTHQLLAQVAKDPEKAVALAQMTSRQRIAELTRMTMAEPKPAPTAPTASALATAAAPAAPARQASRAPAPAPRIDATTTRQLPRYADELSDAEFSAQFNENMERRAKKR